MTETIIQTHNLTKQYHDVQAVKALNLQIPAYSIVGFLGPNGAGKSTTIKLLLGLIHPTRGGGTIFGQDIISQSRQIRQRVGYLAQQPRFDETMSARQTLNFVARFFFPHVSREIDKRVSESLELVGLTAKADRPVKGFSGGELQRLGIAQAQINKPDLLILDEPAAALDPMGRRDVLNIMEQLRTKTTIFYSTHILDDVQRVSDRVVIMNQGELVAQGPIETLLQAEDGLVYHVAVKGNVDTVHARLLGTEWVRDITTNQANGVTHWHIGVDDSQSAGTKLLRTILKEPDIQVLEYGPEAYELEDVFMQIVN